MRPRSRWIAALTLVPAFLAACSDTPPTGVEPTTPAPLLQISDGANAPGREGFYFLSPLVPNPGSFVGTFDATLSPEVRVCQLAGSVCGTVLKVFTTATAEPVDVIANKGTYSVNWSTKNNPSSLTTGVKYRIEVRIGALLLGFADLAFVKTNKETGSVPAGTVAAVLGSPLSIKFRIETRTVGTVTVMPATASIAEGETKAFTAEVRDLHGALVPNAPAIWASSNPAAATVSEASGTSATATAVAMGNTVIMATVGGITGSANVTVMRKPNAEDDSYSGIVAQLLSPGATPALPTLLANDFAGSPAGTITSVRVGATDYPLPLPQGGIPFAGGLLQLWPDGNFSVSTQTAGQFTFRYTLTNAVGSDDALVTVSMGSAAPAAMVAVSDDDQTATVGTAVAEAPSVRVTDAYGNPVAGVSVTFAVSLLSGNAVGSVTGSPATTNANGVATVESWTLGTDRGLGGRLRERLQPLTATAGDLTTTFTGRAVAGPPASVRLIPRGSSGGPFELPTKNPLDAGETEILRAYVVDSYGNAVDGLTVDFSRSDPEALGISPPRLVGDSFGGVLRVPMTEVTVLAGFVTTERSVEIRASAPGRPDLFSTYTMVVTAALPPVAKADAITIEPCEALNCEFGVTFTTNVFLDHGSGPDDLGSPTAVVTKFGLFPQLLQPAGTIITLGGTTGGIGGSSGTSVTLSANGTLAVTYAGTTPNFGGGANAVLYYELKNQLGTSLGVITLSGGSTPPPPCEGTLGCEVGGLKVGTSVPTVGGFKRAKTP